MSEFVSVPGATRTLMPQAMVLLDPTTGAPTAPAPASVTYHGALLGLNASAGVSP
jgi:hypothetical protein